MKGCPLKCKWCDNPESQSIFPEIFFRRVNCNFCGKCLKVCPVEAINLNSREMIINREKCDGCAKCVGVCPLSALSRIGEAVTVEKVISEVKKDRIFYENSGGGITVSGGEPLFQPEFVTALLKECKEASLHTAIDTCGFAKWESMNAVLEYVDLVLFDIKHMNSAIHKSGTGVGNEIILENVIKTIEKGKKIWVRIPVIPGYNDSEDAMRGVIKFLSELEKSIDKISLLAYHEWGRGKYDALDRNYPLPDGTPLSEGSLQDKVGLLEHYGLNVTIGY